MINTCKPAWCKPVHLCATIGAVIVVLCLAIIFAFRSSNSSDEPHEKNVTVSCICGECPTQGQHRSSFGALGNVYTSKLNLIKTQSDGPKEYNVTAVLAIWAVAEIRQRYASSSISVFDVDANLETTENMLRAFNNLQCYDDIKTELFGSSLPKFSFQHWCGADHIRVVAYASNKAELSTFSKENGWDQHNFEPKRLLATTTLNQILASDAQQKKPFFVRINLRSADDFELMLNDANELFSKQKIKYLVLEYNAALFKDEKQRAPTTADSKKVPTTLEGVSAYLYSFGYVCYFVFYNGVIPISPPIWTDNFHHRAIKHSHYTIFCGYMNDPEFCEATLRLSETKDDAQNIQDFVYSIVPSPYVVETAM